MRNWLLTVLVAAGGLVVLSCGGSGSNGSGGGGTGGTRTLTCETLTNPPPGCDDTCPSGSDSECELGTFCLNGTCSAQCTADEGCDESSTCNARGRCVPSSGTGGTAGSGNTGGGNVCQSVTITPTRSIPNVMFLVDQSASMTSSFEGSSENRWQAAHSAINAIVSDPLDDIVRFGLTTYTSRNGFQNGRDCPRLPTQIDFALNNASAFVDDENVYPYDYPGDENNDPTWGGEDTPTGDSIDALVSLIQADPPPDDGPTIIVLATDGLPDSCECADNYPNPIDNADEYCQADPVPDDPQDEAVEAAARARAAGIDVYALWVGNLSTDPTNPTRMHMQAVADAGVAGTGTVYVGNNPTSLSMAFDTIVEDSISCDITMQERFVDPDKACEEGDVRLGGEQIPCSDTDGWRVKPGEDQVIELVGSACDTLKTGDVTFSAEFPCGSVVVE